MLLDIPDIKKERKKHGITQTELALVAGLHPQAITRIESGKLDCRRSTLQRLNDALNIMKKNKHYKFTGAIITDEAKFGNSIWRSIIRELEVLERENKYKGNGHHLSQTLIELIQKEFEFKEEQPD